MGHRLNLKGKVFLFCVLVLSVFQTANCAPVDLDCVARALDRELGHDVSTATRVVHRLSAQTASVMLDWSGCGDLMAAHCRGELLDLTECVGTTVACEVDLARCEAACGFPEKWWGNVGPCPSPSPSARARNAEATTNAGVLTPYATLQADSEPGGEGPLMTGTCSGLVEFPRAGRYPELRDARLRIADVQFE
jgi:hypothetical protein